MQHPATAARSAVAEDATGQPTRSRAASRPEVDRAQPGKLSRCGSNIMLSLLQLLAVEASSGDPKAIRSYKRRLLLAPHVSRQFSATTAMLFVIVCPARNIGVSKPATHTAQCPRHIEQVAYDNTLAAADFKVQVTLRASSPNRVLHPCNSRSACLKSPGKLAAAAALALREAAAGTVPGAKPRVPTSSASYLFHGASDRGCHPAPTAFRKRERTWTCSILSILDQLARSKMRQQKRSAMAAKTRFTSTTQCGDFQTIPEGSVFIR